MHNNSFGNYQYNSCTARGICSINPRISALQTILVLYLRFFAKFSSGIEIDEDTKNFILNTISITILNPDLNEDSFFYAVKNFQNKIPELLKKAYNSDMNDKGIELEKNKINELFKETSEIIDAIKYGEKIFNQVSKEIPTKIRNLYSIMLIIAKSISINLLDYKSFNYNDSEAFDIILNLLKKINLEEKNVNILEKCIIEATKTDINLMKLIHSAQEERYGKQTEAEVSYTTLPNKAVLVVGSNIRELENVLEALKNEDIDIYTHDEMMIAHTFPKFATYSKLKGQFGQGLESCLIDFATFPGPIILTKHSLHNIENFYRGQLFTTDYTTSPKGIIKIENNDYSSVIKTAIQSKGFKHGKNCETISIGYNYEEIKKQIKNKIESNLFKKIFILSSDNFSLEQQAYFEKLIKLTPKDILIISFTYKHESENLIHLNTCFDNYSLIKIFDFLQQYEIPKTIFIPKCHKSSISEIIYFSNNSKTKVYLGKCTPILLNPSLMNTLQSTFKIKNITTAKENLAEIIEDK